MSIRRNTTLALALLACAGCATAAFEQPEIPLPARFQNAEIRITSFEGVNGLSVPTDSPAPSILRGQIASLVMQCSGPGPRLDLSIAVKFAHGAGDRAQPHRIVGVVTWIDPRPRAWSVGATSKRRRRSAAWTRHG